MKSDEPGFRVLVVDDNVDIVDSLSLLLKLKVYDVQVAHDGFAAVEIARSFQPQVVLCDIMMPRMDGYEVAKIIRKDAALNRCYLVAISGNGTNGLTQRCKDVGFNLRLTKPTDPDLIEQIIEMVRCANGNIDTLKHLGGYG